LARADIIRMSDADFEFLFRSADYAAKAATLIESGATLVIVTRGERGVLAWHRHAGYIEVTAPHVDVVDTIGAGDTFQGALLVALHETQATAPQHLAAWDTAGLHKPPPFAVPCAAVPCSRAGAAPPRRSDLRLLNL